MLRFMMIQRSAIQRGRVPRIARLQCERTRFALADAANLLINRSFAFIVTLGYVGASAQTDGRSGVKVPYVKGLTSHYGPESWVADR